MKTTEVNTVEQDNAEVLIQETSQVAVFDPVKVNSLPDLNKDMQVSPVSDVSEYWTPEDKGEQKRVFFDCISTEDVEDTETGEIRTLPSVIMWEQVDGKLRKISNCSARLVGHFKRAMYNAGQPLLITYKGKEKNKNNQYSSDTWDVNKLYTPN